MKKNKNKEPVVINKEALMPSTIGTINNKEKSPVGVIFVFAVLIIAVFFMPTITNYVETFLHPNSNITKESETPTRNTTEKIEEPTLTTTPEKEEEYLNLENTIEKTISGFRFNIEIDNDSQELKTTITNISGSNTFFVNNKYYLELYSLEKQLLERIKIASTEVLSSVNYTYDITTSFSLGKPIYLLIVNKNEKDYPAITLDNLDDYNNPFLTCTKDNETLVYTFEQTNNNYLLRKIKNTYTYDNPTEEDKNTYEAIQNSYDTIDGVDALITNTRTSLIFEADIDLTKVTIYSKKRILNNLAYYEKDTMAKTIAFELNSSGYKCE